EVIFDRKEVILGRWHLQFQCSTHPILLDEVLVLYHEGSFIRLENLDSFAPSDRVIKIRSRGARGADAALWIEGNKRHFSDLCAAAGCGGDDTADGQLAGFLRTLPRAHRLDDQEAAADAEDLLANAGAAGGAGGVV